MNKKHKVIMLPCTDSIRGCIMKRLKIVQGTDEDAELGELVFKSNHAAVSIDSGWQSNHLYVLSDENPKNVITGEWFYCYRTNGIFQAEIDYINCCTGDVKIIASSDLLCIKDNGGPIYEDDFLPSIPNQFLKQYCELGGVDEINVEYTQYFDTHSCERHVWRNGTTEFTKINELKLKVTKDNFISIISI